MLLAPVRKLRNKNCTPTGCGSNDKILRGFKRLSKNWRLHRPHYKLLSGGIKRKCPPQE